MIRVQNYGVHHLSSNKLSNGAIPTGPGIYQVVGIVRANTGVIGKEYLTCMNDGYNNNSDGCCFQTSLGGINASGAGTPNEQGGYERQRERHDKAQLSRSMTRKRSQKSFRKLVVLWSRPTSRFYHGLLYGPSILKPSQISGTTTTLKQQRNRSHTLLL